MTNCNYGLSSDDIDYAGFLLSYFTPQEIREFQNIEMMVEITKPVLFDKIPALKHIPNLVQFFKSNFTFVCVDETFCLVNKAVLEEWTVDDIKRIISK